MRKILCWLGIHDWYLGGMKYISPVGQKHRYCSYCGLEQYPDDRGNWWYFGKQAKALPRD